MALRGINTKFFKWFFLNPTYCSTLPVSRSIVANQSPGEDSPFICTIHMHDTSIHNISQLLLPSQ